MVPRPETLYPPEELLFRPEEHVVEALGCRTLGRFIGLGHSEANEVKQGSRRLTPQERDLLYRNLERAAQGEPLLDGSRIHLKVVDQLRDSWRARRPPEVELPHKLAARARKDGFDPGKPLDEEDLEQLERWALGGSANAHLILLLVREVHRLRGRR